MTDKPSAPTPQPPARLPGLIGRVLAQTWSVLRVPLVGAVNILLALILIFEEWGWKPLAAALAWLARFRLIANIESFIANLSPYPSLLVFALPTTILLPVKIGALWLLAAGHVITAGALLAVAKVVSTALVARIFTLTRPALMQIGWFRRGYEWFVPWKEALFARVRASFAWRYGRMVKSRIKQIARRARDRLRPRVESAYATIKLRGRELWMRYFGQSE